MVRGFPTRSTAEWVGGYLPLHFERSASPLLLTPKKGPPWSTVLAASPGKWKRGQDRVFSQTGATDELQKIYAPFWNRRSISVKNFDAPGVIRGFPGYSPIMNAVNRGS